MSLPTYTLLLDSVGDGTYSTDISAYVHQSSTVEWDHGTNKPLDNMGRESTFSCNLINIDKKFSPSHGSAQAGFHVGAGVKWQMTYGGSTVDLFVGRIETDGIEPMMGNYGERLTTIRASGFMYILDQQPARIAVQQGIATGTAIAEILSNLVAFPPVSVFWAVGVPGYGEIGINTYLGAGITEFANIDTGSVVLNYFGDQISGDDSALDVLRELAETEDGFLWLDRAGKIQFRDNSYFITEQAEAAAATLVGTDIIDGEVVAGAQLINRIRLSFNPRVVGSAGSQIGKYTEQIILDPYNGIYRDNETTIIVEYKDNNNEIGALNVITPTHPTDWEAYNALNSSIDVSASVDFEVEDLGTGLRMTIWSTYLGYTAIDSITVRGTPLIDYGRSEIEMEDADSINNYGLSQASYRRVLLDNATYAQNWAGWKLHQFSTPTDVLDALTITGKSATHWAWIRDLKVGDRIVVTEAQTGITAKSFFIVGTQHKLLEKEHRLTMILRPAPPVAWLLGVEDFSELEETTYLGLGV